MTAIAFARHPAQNLVSAFRQWADRMSMTARRQAEYRRVHDELAGLSDRDLADIGIGRSVIADIARQAASAIR